ncbi:MAG: cytochrome c3 family protein [Desulfatibacillaceae bacterium]
MRTLVFVLATVLLAAAAAGFAAGSDSGAEQTASFDWEIREEDKGAREMVLEGGQVGDVPFPHADHQDTIDCVECHQYFPQEKGAIQNRISKGRMLPKRVVMNQCTQCHRRKKRAGNTDVPTSCRDCHSKD